MCKCPHEMPGTCPGVNNCPMTCPDIQDEIDARMGDLTADDMTEVLESWTREECETFREALKDFVIQRTERNINAIHAMLSEASERLIEKRLRNDH